MHPTLFTLGGLSVPSHEFFVGLGFLAGLAVFLLETRRRRMWDERLIPVVAGIVVGGALGARLAGILDAATQDGGGVLAWAWSEGGRSILGGLTGAYVGALVGKRVGGYSGRTGDLFAPAVAVGLAVGRIGCLLAEAPGRPTSLPWGITVDPAVAASIPECPGCLAGVPMHPSFLYEIAFLVLAFLALRAVRDRIEAPGETFVLFIAAYALFRFGVEFTRANPPDLLGLTRSQVFILVLSPLLALRLHRGWRAGAYDRILPTLTVPTRETT
ncbi:prolipoprotein diacylglyceryl transferase [Longivirga aurantiaca]|uniref:Prolipoprotein diacylglyceryl transferase n=1 Tax=Longivirga aurantiaca TaxID=1837743 RepID=A0ABW1SZQ5_9ACTN